MTDMPYAIYPEGLYRAIKQAGKINKPIIITENGIADATDDRREIFIERYIYAMSRAIKDGANVKGYYYWSFVDNYEWNLGYSMEFGLLGYDLTTKARIERPHFERYQEIIESNGL